MDADVLIIGAGPSGSVAASLLKQRGRRVVILEKERFPRFSIGESCCPSAWNFCRRRGCWMRWRRKASSTRTARPFPAAAGGRNSISGKNSAPARAPPTKCR
ncbi:FAD-dependent oxidoreductase, partial [Methylogaea oryzae]|uniref:FAD-dependent oxidoreductase n=1 Tax=Methylogaea oryzae TaxID=1295382 RepID=UPI00278BC1E2